MHIQCEQYIDLLRATIHCTMIVVNVTNGDGDDKSDDNNDNDSNNNYNNNKK